MSHLYRFGPHELSLDRGVLLRHDLGETRVVHIPPQPFRALEYLVERPGRLVTRDELGDAIWDASVFVDKNLGLNYCILRLRRILGDNARHPRYIQTIPKRGYRFIAEIETREQGRNEICQGECGPARRLSLDNSVSGDCLSADESLRISIFPFASYSSELAEIRFGECLTEEILGKVVSSGSVVALHRSALVSLGAADVVPDLVVTGSVRAVAGTLRVLGYLVRSTDGVILRSSAWQSQCIDLGLDTQVLAAEFLVENLLGSLESVEGKCTATTAS